MTTQVKYFDKADNEIEDMNKAIRAEVFNYQNDEKEDNTNRKLLSIDYYIHERIWLKIKWGIK